MRKSGLPPVVDENTEILILGTLPSDMSLAAGQYYANPGNDFWKLVGAALSKSLDGLSYEDKLELLKANRIGLWDVYHSGVRLGSMDKGITDAEFNDFTVLKRLAPNIRLICFNGREAAEAKESLTRLKYETHLLPSSSPANRKDSEGRLACWKSTIRFTENDITTSAGSQGRVFEMSSNIETFDSLWAYCTENNRMVPMPQEWTRLHSMLANRRQKASGAWEPPLPLILAAWDCTMPIEKQLRFQEHVRWATDHNQLGEVGAFLRALPEEKWVHFGEV